MSLITTQLDDGTYSALEERASRNGQSVEQYAGKILTEHAAANVPKSVPMDPAAFRAALEQTLREKDELYRRLAK